MSIILSVLFWSQIIQRVCWAFFIEESDVFFNLICYIFITCEVKIIKYLCFYPPVNCFHTSTQTTRIYASPSIEMLKAAMENNSVDISETAEWLDNEEELARLCGIR